MNLVALTSVPRGFASLCVGPLIDHPECQLQQVILADGGSTAGPSRKLRKVRRIGLLGALNGLRMRRWFGDDVADALQLEPIDVVARRHGVPLQRVATLNGSATRELLRGAGADLGLALGCTYLRPDIFQLPRMGMINVHHEILPRYRGAQSVIWQIHDGSKRTGFTIHRIDDRIDGGDILYQESMAIELRHTLRATVTATVASLYERSAAVLPGVAADFEAHAAAATPQRGGNRYTTPSIRQYRKIVREFRRMQSR